MRILFFIFILHILILGEAHANTQLDCSPYNRGEYSPEDYYLEPIDNKSPNTSVWLRWTDRAGSTKTLFHRSISPKSKQMWLRITDKTKKTVDRAIEVTASSYVNDECGAPPVYKDSARKYVFRINPLTGSLEHLLITDSEAWPNDESFQSHRISASFQPKDPERKVLQLKTETGVQFPSFYSAPKRQTQINTLKVVILMDGDGSVWLDHATDTHWFMETPTINHLRDQGFIVLLANFRGRSGLSLKFRDEGIGRMYDRGIDDIINALDALHKIHPFKADDVRVIGHSRGGHMAALLATRLAERTKRYTISKSLISSGVFNPVDGYYYYFEDPKINTKIQSSTDSYNLENGIALDFVDDQWIGGALCYDHPLLSPQQVTSVRAMETRYFERWFKSNYQKAKALCDTKTYFEQSPYHYASSFSGKVLALVDATEIGNTSPFGALQFQEMIGAKRMNVVQHHFGHGWYQSNQEAMNFYFKELDSFFKP